MKKISGKTIYVLLGLGIAILVILLIVFILVPKGRMMSDNFADTTTPYAVNLATNRSIALSGLQVIDEIQLNSGDRVLVKDQTNSVENGIYVASAGAWSRSNDFAKDASILSVSVMVKDGTINKETNWVTTNVTPLVVGKDVLFFIRNYQQNYVQKGNGPIMDLFQLTAKIKGDFNKYTKTENGKSVTFDVKRKDIKNMIGYIAPSFAFYPYGIYSKGYGSTKNDSQVGSIIKQLSKIGIGSTPQNIDVGSQICKEMCSKTGCLALETEVTENCIFDDTCVNQSEASCSLYFESVDHADKAYYTISKVNRDMVGRKYYENNTFPDASPDTRYSIDDSPVKWCSTANAEYVNLSNKFETIIGAKAKCTCNNNTQNCDDTNCCKVRNLVTLSGVKLSAPFYQLPFNKRTNELLDAKNSDGSCCGKCTINGITRYISCIGDKGDGWNLAPTANCSSYKPYKDLSSSDKKQLDQDYKEALSNNTLDDFSRTNCTARYETAELKTVQPDCMDNNNWSYNNIRHGCKGGPTVIAADFLINGMPCTSIPGELKCSTSGEMCSDKLAMYCDENSTPLFQPSSN